MEQAGCEQVLYVGDDVTDEDVFSLAGRARVSGVRVGSSQHSRAEWWMRAADQGTTVTACALCVHKVTSSSSMSRESLRAFAAAVIFAT